MNGRLQGKRAIITGASRGIGRAIAIGFAREGASVIINYESIDEEAEAKVVVKEIGRLSGAAFNIKADISRRADIYRLVNQSIDLLGGIDILVNNAGICPWYDFIKLPISIWERTQVINHRGVFLCSQLVAQRMIRQKKEGSIITIASVGAYTGNSRQAHYNASKAAICSLMKSMAVALGSFGIRCNSILPGCIETRMNQAVLANPLERRNLVKKTPLGRIGIPEDIVGASIFFASDESRFCTGAELRIDGGISINI